MAVKLVTLFLVIFLFAQTASQGTNAEKRLLGFLQSKIHKFSPSREMLKNTVGFYADLYQLLDVDEKNGGLTIKLWLYYYYFVTSAIWNPEDYDGIKTISVPADTFWRPDIGEVNYICGNCFNLMSFLVEFIEVKKDW